MAIQGAFEKVVMIGCGSMGGGMALLLAEKGLAVSSQGLLELLLDIESKVHLNDTSQQNIDTLLEKAEEDGLRDKLHPSSGYSDLCGSLGSPKVFIFSLPHGNAGDKVIDGLHKYLARGDIVIDASNEHWENTQRRQNELSPRGIHYIGMGVSGGYQAARRGPSLCPGGKDTALDLVMSLLQTMAVKDARGTACVGKVGTGGSGHYVKMIHNGIEHSMMSSLAEVWQFMVNQLSMDLDSIGSEFARWNQTAELKGTYLIDVGAQVCTKRDVKGNHVLSNIQDKVVQDVDGSEGTGVWSQLEAINLHVPAPSLSAAHFLRVASAYRGTREHIRSTFSMPIAPKVLASPETAKSNSAILEDLRKTTYIAFLAAFIQGMNIIDQADRKYDWKINFSTILQIWRNGCIIKTDFITEILENIFKLSTSKHNRDLLREPQITKELQSNFDSLKNIVSMGIETNAIIPSLSATLEYLKYTTSVNLPTQFCEAQMDFFGKHMFDLKSEPAPDPITGKHHFEWKPA